MSRREVPVVLITGYLGSGKTTLMQHLLMQEERKVALIVNDMGSINIDASLLSKTNNQVAQVEMVEMQNGCICCTLKDEFMNELDQEEDVEDDFVIDFKNLIKKNYGLQVDLGKTLVVGVCVACLSQGT